VPLDVSELRSLFCVATCVTGVIFLLMLVVAASGGERLVVA
jgi:hypothetical protein